MMPYFLLFVQIALFIIGLYFLFAAGVNLLYAHFIGGSKRWWSIPIAASGLAMVIVPFIAF